MKKISILGSTGSIGTQTLEVIAAHPNLFEVVALAAGTNKQLLKEQIKAYSPKVVAVSTKEIADELRTEVSSHIKIYYGEEGLIEAATHADVDFVVVAVVGSVGLKPTIKAIEAKKQIGLANKETLVSAGHIVMKLAEENQVPIIPIDSEHSAIYQSLNGENVRDVSKIILTASGGSFRNMTRKELENVSIEDALNHPNWSMGRKITIDSATMMNKGLEVIEAHWLFNMPYKQIEVVIHPESIIHSMVEYRDKAIIAQLGTPDMRVPIQYAISYPNRIELNSKSLDLTEIGTLHFSKPDEARFPSLRLAFKSGEEGGSLPTVLNAANEIAVEAFLNGRLAFLAIEEVIEEVLGKHRKINNPDIEAIYDTDNWARQKTYELLREKGW